MLLAGLFIYPVKSLRGYAVESADVDALGIAGDRRFLVVDEAGRFLTQRTIPRMARVGTKLTADTLILSAEGAGGVEVPRLAGSHSAAHAAGTRLVSVWKDQGLRAEDCGDEPARWLGDFLGVKCRLVRSGPEYLRPISPQKVPAALTGPPEAPHLVNFADGYPFLVIGEASVADLNDRLVGAGEEPVPMDRFRPNLVIRGSEAFAEDRWKRFRIGSLIFHSAGPCVRCIIPTTDQATGARGVEPLRMLASYRRDPKKPGDVKFGQNLIHETKSGILRVGDTVEVSE